MNREEDHNISPATMGEVNLTLRYMQKTLDVQGGLMKEMGSKLDMMNGNTVSRADFVEYKTHAELSYATKEEVRPLVRIMWGIGALLGAAIVGALLKLILIK